MACRIGFPDWFRLYSSPLEWTAVELSDAWRRGDARARGEIVPMQPTSLKVWEGNCAYCKHRYAQDDMECSHCGAPLPASSSSSPWIVRERALRDYGSCKSPFPYQEWATRSLNLALSGLLYAEEHIQLTLTDWRV